MAIPETRELLLAGLYPLLDDDPFALTRAERHELAASMRVEQAAWHGMLRRAAEGTIAADFPAFLLATPAFASVAASIRRLARHRPQARDRGRMERFLANYASWLVADRAPELPGRRTARTDAADPDAGDPDAGDASRHG